MKSIVLRIIRSFLSYTFAYLISQYQNNDFYIIFAPVLQSVCKALRELGKKYGWTWTNYLPF